MLELKDSSVYLNFSVSIGLRLDTPEKRQGRLETFPVLAKTFPRETSKVKLINFMAEALDCAARLLPLGRSLGTALSMAIIPDTSYN